MIEKLLKGTGEWLAARGPESDIVITSRVRLARNLATYPFTLIAQHEQLVQVRDAVLAAAKQAAPLADALYFDMLSASDLEKNMLVERHMVSHNLLQVPAGGALIKNDETISIMINEEDHLRLTSLLSGLQLQAAYRVVAEVDDRFEEQLEYAFDPEWGYLTSCPTNTGTGMRASVLVHLPALIMTRRINKILKGVSKLNLAVRGYYGEGTDSIGDFFQISNQETLGKKEEQILAGIEDVTHKIVYYESMARHQLYARSKAELEDRVWRAYGLLCSARLLSAEETMEVLSALRLGINMEIIKDVDMHVLNEIFLNMQPAHLEYYGGPAYKPSLKDYLRAKMIREKLKC